MPYRDSKLLYTILLVAAVSQFLLVFEFKSEFVVNAEPWRWFLSFLIRKHDPESVVRVGFFVRESWGYEGVVLGFILPIAEVFAGTFFLRLIKSQE